MTIWMTRDEPRDGPLCQALRNAALEFIHAPVLSRRVVPGSLEDLPNFEPQDWLVLTSPFAVTEIPESIGRKMQVAVVGHSSRRLAEERGFRVELVSPHLDAASLFSELRARAIRGRILYPRSALVEAPESWDGVELISPIYYKTEPCSIDSTMVANADIATVTSASVVDVIANRDIRFASIGPSTSRALRAHGKEPWVEAHDRTFESLARAIADQTSP